MTLKSLPPQARPREKLLERGPAALADAELLAVLLRTGTASQGVMQLAQAVLERSGGWHGLLHSTPAQLTGIKGLGPAKRAELLAVLEIVRRALGSELAQRPVLDGPQAVKDFLALHLRALAHESFAILYLDAQHRLLRFEELFRGTLTQTSVYPREVIKRALEMNAAALIFAHNHPSGMAEPSRADELLTQSLRSALQMVDVIVLDHFIVGSAEVVSLAERGLL